MWIPERETEREFKRNHVDTREKERERERERERGEREREERERQRERPQEGPCGYQSHPGHGAG
jgi:ATP-dependent RNA helicase DDX46/PRP5